MHEVTARSIRTEPNRVESPAKFRFILGMSTQRAKFISTMGKLALGTIFAMSTLLERSAQFSLVPRRIHVVLQLSIAIPSWLTDTAIQPAVLCVDVNGGVRIGDIHSVDSGVDCVDSGW